MSSNVTWGLQRDITPRLGARLVQEATGYTIWLTGQASLVN